jgi:hypothetical protein
MARPKPVTVHFTKTEVQWLENWLVEDATPTEDADIKMANKILEQIGSDYSIVWKSKEM